MVLFSPRFMPCPECGESVEQSAADDHRCSAERRVDYQMYALRDEIGACETQWQSYQQTATGRFEVWLAARQVRGSVR
jgi:hypothetical protein